MKSRTKVFFDTEFTGLHQNTTLISIGLISECGKTFYAELTDYDINQVFHQQHCHWKGIACTYNEFVKNSKGLDIKPFGFTDLDNNIGNTTQIRAKLLDWFSQFEEIEMWSDCLSYDWVLFNQIFGHAFNIPKNVYYIPFDLSTLFLIKGIDPDISRKEYSGLDLENHNALNDAKMIKACYDRIQSEQDKLTKFVENMESKSEEPKKKSLKDLLTNPIKHRVLYKYEKTIENIIKEAIFGNKSSKEKSAESNYK